MEFPAVIHWAIPMFVLTMGIEAFWLHHSDSKARVGYGWSDTLCSLSLGVGNVIVGLVGTTVYLWVMQWIWAYRLVDLGVSWPVILVAMLLDDLRYYWQHRLSHELRWLWAAHVTHHSSNHYNLSTALRQPWTTLPTGVMFLGVPLVLMGFHPQLLLFCAAVNLVYQFWVHTEIVDRCPPWMEAVFNTPSHHRVHHGNNHIYLDANYAGILIVWDRLFGTFIPEAAHTRVRYGLVHDLNSYNPVRAAFHEWAAMFKDASRPGLSMRARWGYLWGPPGWSHDGSRQTAKELRAQARATDHAPTMPRG